MNKLGSIDIDKLDAIKAELAGFAKEITVCDDALQMIRELENTIVTMTLNHMSYCEWAAKEILRYQNKAIDASWSENPDRSGGQFTQDEIDESSRGGYGW